MMRFFGSSSQCHRARVWEKIFPYGWPQLRHLFAIPFLVQIPDPLHQSKLLNKNHHLLHLRIFPCVIVKVDYTICAQLCQWWYIMFSYSNNLLESGQISCEGRDAESFKFNGNCWWIFGVNCMQSIIAGISQKCSLFAWLPFLGHGGFIFAICLSHEGYEGRLNKLMIRYIKQPHYEGYIVLVITVHVLPPRRAFIIAAVSSSHFCSNSNNDNWLGSAVTASNMLLMVN